MRVYDRRQAGTIKAQRGTSLIEACLAFSLIMVSVLGCATALQIGVKLRKSIEIKTRMLTKLEELADAAERTASGEALEALLNAAKIRLEKEFAGSHLYWDAQPAQPGQQAQPAEQVYQICFLRTLREIDRIKFIVVPADFH